MKRKTLPLNSLRWLLLPLGLLLLLWSIRLLGLGEPYVAGKVHYDTYCASCHMEQGQGLGTLIPPLAGADYLMEGGAELACLIRHGIEHKIVVNGVSYHHPMPGNTHLRPPEILSLINYIRNAWGNRAQALNFDAITRALAQCDSLSTP